MIGLRPAPGVPGHQVRARAAPGARRSPCSTTTRTSRRAWSRTAGRSAVIGVSLDGLGYGDDGGLWGGEVLVCDLLGYRRVGSSGGAAAAGRRGGHRAAVAHRARLELRAARRGRARAGGAAAAQPRRGRRAPSSTDEDVAVVAPADRRRRQRAAHDELRPPVRRRRRARRRAPRDHLRGPGGDRARDALRGRRRAVSLRRRRRRRGRRRRAALRRRRVGRAHAAGGDSGSPPAVVRLAPLFVGRARRPRGRRARPAPSAPACTPRSRRSCSRSAAGCARRPASTSVALAGGVFQNRLLTDSVRGRARAPTASRCSPPASCPPTTAASRWGRPRWRAILCCRRRGELD